jgi:adenylate cyclase
MRVPILFKLILMTVLLLLAVAVPIALRNSQKFAAAASRREELTNAEYAALGAVNLENLVADLIYKTQLSAVGLLKSMETGANSHEMEFGFNSDRNFYSLEIRQVDGAIVKKVVKENLLAQVCAASSTSGGVAKRKCVADGFADLVSRTSFPVMSVIAGNIELQNATVNNGPAVFTLGIPLIRDPQGKITHIAIAQIDLGVIQGVIEKASSVSNERTFFVTDKNGILLGHSDENRVLARESFVASEIVSIAGKSMFEREQKKTRDVSKQTSAYSAFAKTRFGLTVFAEIPEETVLVPAREAKREVVFISGIVLSAALFVVFLFSLTLTAPIAKLVKIVEVISKGNFEIKASSHIRSVLRDEVNTLASAFDVMTKGLKERDKVKGLFQKFHGSSVTEDLLRGDVALKGQRKNVLVFFSDIRGFTAYSEKRDPAEVVEMLNEYFAVMVSVINKHGGVVDKFIGDAIMAIWGAPKPTANDARNAVMACLMMRKGLETLNEKRVAAGKSPIVIGMGLHAGPAISGPIGSNERMEYTVIGNTVNTTARIEASTKVFGEDLLVTEDVVKLIESEFWMEYAGSAEIKGSSAEVRLYTVRGYVDEKGQVVTVKSKYAQFDVGESTKVRVRGVA